MFTQRTQAFVPITRRSTATSVSLGTTQPPEASHVLASSPRHSPHSRVHLTAPLSREPVHFSPFPAVSPTKSSSSLSLLLTRPRHPWDLYSVSRIKPHGLCGCEASELRSSCLFSKCSYQKCVPQPTRLFISDFFTCPYCPQTQESPWGLGECPLNFYFPGNTRSQGPQEA